MKKLLLATTVLVGSAGFAAAEVSVSGDARMGIVYDDFLASSVYFDSRARANFTLSGETDGGLSFGASFRADNAENAAEGTVGAVFLSGEFGTISMGDVESAAENAVGDLAGVGYTSFSYFDGWSLIDEESFDGGLGNEMEYIATGDDEMALYQYSTGAVTLYASVGQPGDGVVSYSVAGRYDAEQFSVSLGYEDLEGFGSHIIGGVQGTFGNVTVKAIYGTMSADAPFVDVDQYGVSGSYTMDALTVDGFWRNTKAETGEEIAAYGIGATYDLGGGAAIEGGVGQIDTGPSKNTIADLGVTFEF